MSVPVKLMYLTHQADCVRATGDGAGCTCKPVEKPSLEEANRAAGNNYRLVQVKSVLFPYPRQGRESQASRHLRPISE